MINELKKKISDAEDNRVMEKLKDFPLKWERTAYLEGYADAILYINDNYDLELKGGGK